ncbi:MAG: hypothetical protein AAGF57_12660 [Pseudomonadota bacterium]
MNLLILLALIFGGVSLMVVISKRFSGANDERNAQRLQRWLLPLVGIMLVLTLVNYFL